MEKEQMEKRLQKLYVKNALNVSELIIPTASLKTPFANTEISENKDCEQRENR